MIRRLTGEIVDVGMSAITVDVGGVGYLVYMPHASDMKVASTVLLHTHLAVRENAMDLYGFLTQDELHMFELLLTIPKIGPKSALQIMNQADMALLRKAISSDDPVYLSKMSGIGKKSAEKIVTELKDKFDRFGEEVEEGGAGAGESDIVDALVTLGYSERSARETVRKLPDDLTDTKARITEALKLLSQ
jgi:Holliday junction DNA helicase RuvA